jgi:hypothetical protein
MDYHNFMVNGVQVDKDGLNQYLDGLIGKVFAVLGVYEDCTEANDYSIFDSYVYRVESELEGFYHISGVVPFLSLSSILEDLREKIAEDSKKEASERDMTHKRVKSLVFHCISIVKKEKVS